MEKKKTREPDESSPNTVVAREKKGPRKLNQTYEEPNELKIVVREQSV